MATLLTDETGGLTLGGNGAIITAETMAAKKRKENSGSPDCLRMPLAEDMSYQDHITIEHNASSLVGCNSTAMLISTNKQRGLNRKLVTATAKRPSTVMSHRSGDLTKNDRKLANKDQLSAVNVYQDSTSINKNLLNQKQNFN